MRCPIFQINNNLLITERNINIFTQETLYPSFISKKNSALQRKHFSKHPHFTPFLLFLTVRKVLIFQINTDFLINHLQNLFFFTQLFYKTPYTAPSFQQKSCALDRRRFQKVRLFTTFLPKAIGVFYHRSF